MSLQCVPEGKGVCPFSVYQMVEVCVLSVCTRWSKGVCPFSVYQME